MPGGPIVEGTEDIVSQDETKYLWGVEQKTGYGVALDLIVAAISGGGLIKAIEKQVAKAVGAEIAAFLFDHVFDLIPTTRIVNIELNRYIVRGADRKLRFKVYATFRNLDGSFLESVLSQEGLSTY